MTYSIPSKSNIILNRYSYCFRMKVPPDLRPIVQKTELRYSLKTGYLGHAKSQARLMAGLTQKLFTFLRENRDKMKLDSTYINDIIEIFKSISLHNHISGQLASAETPADLVHVFGHLLADIATVKIGQQAGASPWVTGALEDILAGMGYKVGQDLDVAQHNEINRSLMRVTIERLIEEKERLKAELSILLG
ncbi:DUF6538 domain-containing protein [Desulfatitalea tepidiphila]|uniref:DUF6538 domain-containing protein n=1 Tax=Desulfatitalea tepidiphila TaxID=1185843 RepID=UPI0006B52262|nr:DUF6538 domain-containing protein [Desulfatitalea tepidiphila]